jgi:hypothetical protein
LHAFIGREHSELSVTGICRVGAVMEPASNFLNSAAVPFCSHSKTIDASLGNYDTPGFKLEQLLETGATEAVATIRHDIISTGSNRAERLNSPLGSLGRIALAKRGTANAQRRRGSHNSSDNIVRTHKHPPKNKRELAFGATIGDAQH